MKMVRWVSGKRLWNKVPSVELRDRLDIERVSERNGLTKEDGDYVRKCI